jgi:hypothetical protein
MTTEYPHHTELQLRIAAALGLEPAKDEPAYSARHLNSLVGAVTNIETLISERCLQAVKEFADGRDTTQWEADHPLVKGHHTYELTKEQAPLK